MTKAPWVPFFPSDWLSGTRGLTAVETGIYITLIMMMYERREPLRDDPARLARLCGASQSAFVKALDALVADGKIERSDAGLWNARVNSTLANCEKNSEVARASANSRWRKSQTKSTADECEGNAGAMLRGRLPQPQPHIDSSLRSESIAGEAGASAPDRPVTSLESQRQQMLDAGGAALHPEIDLQPMSEAIRWANGGCDFEQDVLPAIRAVAEGCVRRHAKPIRSWSYFADAVFEAKNRRLAPAPAVSAPQRGPPSAPAETIATRMLREMEANNASG